MASETRLTDRLLDAIVEFQTADDRRGAALREIRALLTDLRQDLASNGRERLVRLIAVEIEARDEDVKVQ